MSDVCTVCSYRKLMKNTGLHLRTTNLVFNIKNLMQTCVFCSSSPGMNSKVHYSFEDSAGGLFSIEESSGIISLEGTLDRQKKAVYVLRVRATDRGSPHRLSSLTSVVVTILDSNDHPPAFERRNYISTVSEDVAIGTKLLNVFAASGDEEMTSQATYSITSGNEKGAFSINSQTGDTHALFPTDS